MKPAPKPRSKKGKLVIYRDVTGAVTNARVITGSGTHDFPVTNARESTIKRTMRSLFGSLDIIYVDVIPQDGK